MKTTWFCFQKIFLFFVFRFWQKHFAAGQCTVVIIAEVDDEQLGDVSADSDLEIGQDS